MGSLTQHVAKDYQVVNYIPPPPFQENNYVLCSMEEISYVFNFLGLSTAFLCTQGFFFLPSASNPVQQLATTCNSATIVTLRA